ncbi:hypothetical protein N7495_007625 [Penicillium taxi]|uniref:uncharacterized protein n=1 Tax=Penicillium taxi TaxID=168475 RepID=UPI002544E93E|nr:uncharacterized protein N7495_007625 [Penicillium taxi]KAJ5887584.1 hypothetical protein N7495_007625 [Penicillium taxi]
MAPRSSARRSVRHTRKPVVSYHESSDDSEDTEDKAEEIYTTQQRSNGNSGRRISDSLRPRGAQPPSYREASAASDVSMEGVIDSSELSVHGATSFHSASNSASGPTAPISAVAVRVSKRPRGSAPRSAPSKLKQTKRPLQQTSKQLEGSRKRVKISLDDSVIQGPGVIQTLPYHVLLAIFMHIAQPPIAELTNTGTALRSPYAGPLIGISLLCRAFHEPALSALYYSPPVTYSVKAHGLLSLLQSPRDSQSINYAGKIKELHLDAESILFLKGGARGYFDLAELLQKTPLVHTLRLYHHSDAIFGLPDWELSISKWVYTERIFTAIDASGLRLRKWEWNGRFFDSKQIMPFMLRQNAQASFQSLKDVRLVHIRSDGHNGLKEIAFANSLKVLPQLERLEFHECSAVNEVFLQLLPSTLVSLHISNCDRIYSEILGNYLESHGNNIRELILCHNRHLNMAFVVNLGKYCPNLERFKMDISMYDTSNYHNIEPHFDELLPSGQAPTWPKKLQVVELFNLRRLDEPQAELFFQSLVDAAGDLLDLRHLKIGAIVNIEWRRRAEFRERWIPYLAHIFLRNSNMKSLQNRLLPSTESNPAASTDIQTFPKHERRRQSTRLANIHQITPSQKLIPSSDSGWMSGTDSPLKWNKQSHHNEHVHGMCNVVSVRIDNQRPNDVQFHEADFLDDEASDDSEWDGEDLDIEDNPAW